MDSEVIDTLRQRLGIYPPARYPVQHAVTRFHLGQALLQDGRVGEAVGSLKESLRCFPEQMAVERAKVHNLLGAARRSQGDLAAAEASFTAAATTFAVNGLSAEEGAARFNLGLLRRDAGDPTAAVALFQQAQLRFADGALGPRAMVGLHLGTALLEAGEVDAAALALRDAVALAERLGDRDAVGTAANALGLAHLAADHAADAVEALGLAVSAHPRSVRPEAHAMAKANLALAHEAASCPPRARLAARQALAVGAPPAAVVEQARAVLQRVGSAGGSDLLIVLDEEPPEGWAATIREEVARWAAESSTSCCLPAIGAFISGLSERAGMADQVLHAWLTALLELPPADLDTVVDAVLRAGEDVTDQDVARRFHDRIQRVMAWFPVPQLLRLRDRFEQHAAALGQDVAWQRRRS